MMGLQHQSWRTLWVGALLALLACASCAPVHKPIVPPPPPVVIEPTPEALPPPPPVIAGPQADSALKVAVLVPLTGGAARIGQAIANAAHLAALDAKSAKLRLSVYDTSNDPAGAARTALSEGAKMILGPLFAADARAIQPLANAANVPMITFSNDATLAQNGTYVLGFQPGQDVSRIIAYARQQGIMRFAALAPQGQYGQVALHALQGAGVSLVAIETYPRDKAKVFAAARRVANYEARLLAARSAAAKGEGSSTAGGLPPPPFEALLLPETGSFLRTLLPLLKSYSVKPPQVRFLGTGLWAADPGFLKDPLIAGAWFAAVPDAQFNRMAQRFAQHYGYTPPRLASLGYDGVLLAVAGARQWSVGKPFPVSILNASAGYTGVDGYFRFSNNIAVRGLEVRETSPTGTRVISSAGRGQ